MHISVGSCLLQIHGWGKKFHKWLGLWFWVAGSNENQANLTGWSKGWALQKIAPRCLNLVRWVCNRPGYDLRVHMHIPHNLASSNLNCYSMLCSSSTSPPQVSYAGWSDARPQQWMTDWNYPHHFQQGSTGVSSGYMQQPLLCSIPVTCFVWNPPVTPVCQAQPTPSLVTPVCQAQPTPSLPPSSGGPAYCSSCMLFGNVFTVGSVYTIWTTL